MPWNEGEPAGTKHEAMVLGFERARPTAAGARYGDPYIES